MDTLTIIIAGGILLIAIVMAFVFANRTSWRRMLKSSPAIEESDDSDSSTAVDHYTEMRDELTLKDAGVEEEEEEEVEETKGGFSIITGIVSLTIVAIVFSTVLMPTLKTYTNTFNTTNSGLSGAMTSSVFSWLPIIIIVGFVFVILSVFGLGSSSSSSDDKKTKRKKGVKHYTSMRDKLSEK